MREGVWPVAGVDEAGRGPLAGPVCAAAVILDPSRLPAGVDDSKRLSAAAREEAYGLIAGTATAIAVALASAEEVDATNIRRASHAAMRRAAAALAVAPAYLLIDGNDMPGGLPCAGEALVKGDARALSIAAASIVAKVTRDRLMRRLAAHHPAYGFARHVGYPTPGHLAALRANGACPYHRRTFAPVRALHPGDGPGRGAAEAGMSEKSTGRPRQP